MEKKKKPQKFSLGFFGKKKKKYSENPKIRKSENSRFVEKKKKKKDEKTRKTRKPENQKKKRPQKFSLGFFGKKQKKKFRESENPKI